MLKEQQVEKLLSEIKKLKDEQQDVKHILKAYKIKSDRLDELKKMKRDLMDQIKAEQAEIENEFLQDSDYKDCTERNVKLKENLREKRAQLKAVSATIDTDKAIASYKYHIDGEPVQLDVERVVKLYVNGTEEK